MLSHDSSSCAEEPDHYRVTPQRWLWIGLDVVFGLKRIFKLFKRNQVKLNRIAMENLFSPNDEKVIKSLIKIMGNNGKLLEQDLMSRGRIWSYYNEDQIVELIKIFRDKSHPWMNE